MPFLIAVAGLSGAGKTTAIDYLTNFAGGQKVYLGDTVLNEVRARGLPATPENERSVRLDIRLQRGPGALAVLAAPIIQTLLKDGINVLVDAIFEIEEYQHLQTRCENSTPVLLGIEASFAVRAHRLRSRAERPLTRDQLKARDNTEATKLGTRSVIAGARYKIVNEGSMQAFHKELERFWREATDVAFR